MQVKFVYYDRAYKNLRPEIDLEIQRVLSAGDLILRKDVEIFEENLSHFVGTKYAVAVSSGTAALYLSIKALGLYGKFIAVPSHTFRATAGVVEDSGNMLFVYDMDGSKNANTPIDYTEVVAHIPVHIAGEISDCKRFASVPIIEDACQAIGAVKNPTTNAQCWSFYPAKILGSFGDAGAVTTNDENIAEYIREVRNHCKTSNSIGFGGNYRMDNLQASVLNVKFKYLSLFLERRKAVAETYLSSFRDLPLGLPNNTEGRSWQDFIVRTEKRDELYDFLKKEGIETMKNEYSWPQLYFKLPLAAKYEAETLRLPCNAEIMDEEVEYVIQKVKEFYV